MRVKSGPACRQVPCTSSRLATFTSPDQAVRFTASLECEVRSSSVVAVTSAVGVSPAKGVEATWWWKRLAAEANEAVPSAAPTDEVVVGSMVANGQCERKGDAQRWVQMPE